LEKILVTGANGYFGACVFEELRKKYPVEKLKVRLEDIKPGSLNFDLVIHCAAALRYRKGQHKLANTEGTQKLIRGFQNKPKLIYISSKSVYGIGLEGDLTELNQPKPSDDYGITKYEGELAVIESGLPYIILRSSTLFGLGINNLGPAFPSVAMNQLSLGNDIKLFTPDIFHEYLYVKDLANVVSKLIVTPNSWNTIFNASGPKRSLHELIYLIESFLQQKKIKTGKIQKVVNNGQKLFYLDSSKLLNIVGSGIYTPDKKIVELMVDFILSNANH